MLTRRKFLKLTAAAGAGLTLPWTSLVPRALRAGRALAAIPGGSLDPKQITKYVMPLVIPPAMPPAGPDYYEIAVRQFDQQILPPGMPETPVWSYGSVSNRATAFKGGTFHYPAFTVEAQAGRPVRVKWINELVNKNGNFLPHLLPVDPTLHWANPPGGIAGRDMAPMWMMTPGPYTGPVPMVPHLHGGHSAEESDGFAEAWFLPVAGNIPAGYAPVGTWYDPFKAKFSGRFGVTWAPGTATFQYENDQRATTLWYHDHSLGMTRVNVYAGPAGFYLIRGGSDDLSPGVLPGPAPGVGGNPFGAYYEIPLAIQDRSFNRDGTLFYPDSRRFFDKYNGPYIPTTDVPPIWNPEFFGNTMVVNGRTWPVLTVEPRRYRFRFLNGCNSRFLILKMVTNPLAPRPAAASLPFWQIGTEGGFLPAPVTLSQLLMGPAERADVIVDFSGLPAGTQVFLINEGPDSPFGGGVINVDFFPSDPATTGQVMKFVVGTLTGTDNTWNPATQASPLPTITPLAGGTLRQVSLNEVMSAFFPGPVMALLGTLDANSVGVPKKWDDPTTENPILGSTELWEIHNFTADAHPIHLHQVMFQVVEREVMGGPTRPPETWETGFKDTVIAFPGEITRIRANFDLAGLYVWHCHIVEHEDNEMMRKLVVA